ncbi:MAG: hypothetical protein LBU48_05460 [Coriobacteriales bacterium]|jgi:hypothetical protein|nr:hypothetical protein [Coriobacteriales bacterium]
MPDFIWNLPSLLLGSSSDGYGYHLIPLVLCFSGFIFYIAVYLRYRNTDKRHHHEHETTTNIAHLQQYDQLVKHRTKLRTATMQDSNDSRIEGALSGGSDLPASLKGLAGTIGGFTNGK